MFEVIEGARAKSRMSAGLGMGAASGVPSGHAPRAVITTGTTLAILALISSNVYFVDWSRHGGAAPLGQEHGMLEMLQLALMVPAIALFVLSQRYGVGAVKVAGGLLAMLTAAAFVREFELQSLGAPASFLWLSSDNLQDVLLLILTVAMLAYGFSQRHHVWDLVRLGLRRQSWPIYAAGLPLAASVLLDGHLVAGDEMRFWEELIEYNGYALLLVAAWRHAGLIGDAAYRHVARQTA